ncbi:MAG: sulfite exporter TauE/SafE family protein [Simkaniaceae bacterium]|nr:sulfite exporter TauE/SafE family protein [Simkaniaceae bacterium]
MTGAIAGILSGLIGIGGGVVVVPCLYYTLAFLKVPQEELMQIVLGTSLATIAFNTLVSSTAHFKKKGVLIRPLKRMTPGLILGAIAGATLANFLPSSGLKLIFAVFEIALGVYFFFLGPEEIADTNKLPKILAMSSMGLVIGALSALLGIGGGVLTVPTLLFFKVPMKKAIGTSAAASFIIAVAGTISYLFYGIGTLSIKFTIGFVYLPALLAICGGSLIAAPLAVELAHRLPTQMLKKIFSVVLIAIGIFMIAK